jgi:hypothetical protein
MKALLAIAAVIASAPLLAAVSDDDSSDNPNRQICRHMRPRTSETRLGTQRVCHTAAEWRRIQENGAGTADTSTLFRDSTRVEFDPFDRKHRPN